MRRCAWAVLGLGLWAAGVGGVAGGGGGAGMGAEPPTHG